MVRFFTWDSPGLDGYKRYRKIFLLYWLLSRNILLLHGLHCRSIVHGLMVLAVQNVVQSTGSKSSLYGTGCKLPPARVLLLQHWNRPWGAGPRCAMYMYTYSPRSEDPGCTVHDIVRQMLGPSLYSIGNTPWIQVPRCTVQDRLNCLKILAVCTVQAEVQARSAMHGTVQGWVTSLCTGVALMQKQSTSQRPCAFRASAGCA
jgi:hypothetical protein